jgi:rSAM/selenodomain-associated transferase 2
MKQEIGNAPTGIMRTQVISIIVPTLNEGSTIEEFLGALRERTGAAEIIVVDGGSRDRTFELARDRCDQCLRSSRGRAVQLNTGAAAASGDILWFLHADIEVPADCLQQISDVLRDPKIVGGFFRIRIPSRRFVYRLTDSFAHYAGLLLRMRFGDHGLFCRRAVFREIGGFPELPLMEDAEFFRKLRSRGRMAIVSSPLISSPRRYEQIGPWRLTLTYGLIALLYFLRVSNPILARIYRNTCALEVRLPA